MLFNVSTRIVEIDHYLQKGASMTRPTREAAKGTKVTLDFGGTVLTGHLNDSETARAMAERLRELARSL